MNIDNFQLLTQIVDVSLEEGVLYSKAYVPGSSRVFDVHFPDYPILPGVLMIEIMAQSAGYLALINSGFQTMAILAKVSHCKFSKPIMPGEELFCKVNMKRCEHGIMINTVELKSGESVCAAAEIRMKIIDFPSQKAKRFVMENYRYLTEATFRPMEIA